MARADELIVQQTNCWCCGTSIEAFAYLINGRISHYHCDNCDVWYTGSARENGMYTDPGEMKKYGYIDHALVHVPCP